jgi:hypothetical protein
MLIALAVLAAVLVFGHGLGAVAWALAVPAALLYWRWDIKRHPRVRCRFCSGSGDHRSRLGGGRFRKPFGDCWACGGRKAFPRPGLRFVDRKRYDEIKGAIAKGRSKI